MVTRRLVMERLLREDSEHVQSSPNKNARMSELTTTLKKLKGRYLEDRNQEREFVVAQRAREREEDR